jgi:hypothetical protein
MNLFVFNQDTSHIRIANDFWIYIAICLPLTLVTVVYWYLKTNKSRADRRRHFEASQRTDAAFAAAAATAPNGWIPLYSLHKRLTGQD